MLQSPHSSRHSISSHLGRYYHLGTILPRNEPENRRDISRYVVPPDAAAFTPSSCPNRFLSHGWDEPLPLFPFPLFTLLVHRCVPIAYTGVNCRDRHLCIRTRPRSGRGTSSASWSVPACRDLRTCARFAAVGSPSRLGQRLVLATARRTQVRLRGAVLSR